MTDELTSEQEAAVRRLLAEARHDAPVPADVAARLDGVLDGLAAADGADELEVIVPGGYRSGSVTDLADVRRRRRKAGRLLLAAAAVVVGGVAVGQGLGGPGLDAGGGDSSEADGALAESPRASADRAQEPESGDDTIGGEAPAEAAGSAVSGEAYLLDQVEAPLELTSDNFAADVQRELLRTAAARRKAANADYDGVLAYTSANDDFVCAVGPYGEGATLPAYYDAEEAVLVLRRPRAGIQRVDLLTCGTALTLDSVELPAP